MSVKGRAPKWKCSMLGIIKRDGDGRTKRPSTNYEKISLDGGGSRQKRDLMQIIITFRFNYAKKAGRGEIIVRSEHYKAGRAEDAGKRRHRNFLILHMT
jgi:hypothetical protein